MKLIDGHAMIQRVEALHKRGAVDLSYFNIVKEAVQMEPAVDAALVVHARWIEYPLCLGYVGAYSEDHIVCSNCKTVWSIINNETERFEHCPHCGARMDGEADA